MSKYLITEQDVWRVYIARYGGRCFITKYNKDKKYQFTVDGPLGCGSINEQGLELEGCKKPLDFVKWADEEEKINNNYNLRLSFGDERKKFVNAGGDAVFIEQIFVPYGQEDICAFVKIYSSSATLEYVVDRYGRFEGNNKSLNLIARCKVKGME